MNIIQYLITELGCDPTIPNNNRRVSHYTLLVSMTTWMPSKYFIIEQYCDPNSRDQHGRTLLHYASEGGRHMNIIQYLVTELGCDSNYSRQYWQSPTTHCLSQWPLGCNYIFHH